MGLKTVAKFGTVVSVLLFCLAVGFYAFTRLDLAEHNRNVNLFSLVPASTVAVLESDNIDAFLNKYPNYNYGQELERFHFPGLFNFLINELNEYTTHGLSNQMSRLMVSFHHPGTSRDQVVYFRMGMADERMLSDMLQEYVPGNFSPKEEEYRGKRMLVYPLSHEEFLVAYTEKGFVVLSYQKRLVEEVIDAQLDHSSLDDDEVFSRMLQKKKTPDFLVLYGRSTSVPFLDMGKDGWSEYEFHMNSDVVYLTGDEYLSDEANCMATARMSLKEIPVLREDGMMISTEKDSTMVYTNEAFDANDTGNRSLFNECVANLSNEASFSLVVDMQKVEESPERFKDYLPPFVLNNAACFRSFILSVQLSLNGERPSHIWVFTYKH